MTRRQFLALIVPLLAVFVGFLVMFAVERSGPPGAPPWDDAFVRYARQRMGDEYVWGIADDRKGWEAYFRAVNEYVKTFDAYAEVVPPWEVERSRERSSGQYRGVGIRIRPVPDAPDEPLEAIRVTGVKPDGPADQAGIRIGDLIVAVDGTPIPELDGALETAIRGPEGSTVRLTLRAPDATVREVEATRAQIDEGSVFGARFADEANGVGYVRLDSFETATARDLRARIAELQERGLKALILDLRENTGGLLEPALEVADLFVSDGILMRQRGRKGEYTQTYRAHAANTLSEGLPLAILIDRRTASASEVLAGALQDHRRAVIVGERSWGKFLVQIVEAVGTKAGTALFRRTTSIYETPLGHHYQRSRPAHEEDPMAGLAPDVFIPLEDRTLATLTQVFQHEMLADWNSDEPHPHPDFVDPHVAAAVAALTGGAYYPTLPSLER